MQLSFTLAISSLILWLLSIGKCLWVKILSLHTFSQRRRAVTSPAGGPQPLLLPLSNILFSDGVVSVESCPGSSGWPETLKLLEGPGYQPSYAKWDLFSPQCSQVQLQGSSLCRRAGDCAGAGVPGWVQNASPWSTSTSSLLQVQYIPLLLSSMYIWSLLNQLNRS